MRNLALLAGLIWLTACEPQPGWCPQPVKADDRPVPQITLHGSATSRRPSNGTAVSDPRRFATRIERSRRTVQLREDGQETPGFGLVTFVTLGAALAGMAAMKMLEDAGRQV